MEQQALSRISRRRGRLLAAYGVVIAAYIAAVVWIMFDLRVAVWIANITTLFYIFAVRRWDKKYNRAFARENLVLCCGQFLDQVEVLDRGGVTREMLEEQALFPTKKDGNGVACGLAVTGRKNGRSVTACEITTYYPRAQKKAAVLDGLWLDVALPADTGQRLVLVQRSVIPQEDRAGFYGEQGLKPVPILEDELKDQFVLYGPEQGVPRAAAFLKQCLPLIQCAEKEDRGLLLGLKGDRLCAFITRRHLTFSTPLLGKLTSDILCWNRLPELKMLLDIGEYCLRHTSP